MRIVQLLFICICCFNLLNGQTIFKINDFKAYETNLSLVGNATSFVNKLVLTSSKPNTKGACWYKERSIDIVKGFETEFTFLISQSDINHNGGDGFAFVIHKQNLLSIGGFGDELGYKGIKDCVVIEFDTYNNNEGSKNHVALSFYEKEKGDYRKFSTVHEIPEITDGNQHFTKIAYKDGFLTVYLDSYLFPILSTKIDIGEKINSSDGEAWVGFTSSTSSAHAEHALLTWNLKQFLPPPDIVEENIEVVNTHEIAVKNRKLRLRIWDHNKIDGDVVSLKWGDEWIITEYKLTADKKEIDIVLTGFNKQLILFANNMGAIPPNTASVEIYDGIETQTIVLDADKQSSEGVLIKLAN